MYDDTDEETFRPWLGDFPVGAEETFLVSARLIFADGAKFHGFVTPADSCEGIRGMGRIQPQVFAPSGERFAFWHGAFRDAESERRFYYAFAKTTEQVFPVRFHPLDGLTSCVAAGAIPGFLSIPDGDSVEITK